MFIFKYNPELQLDFNNIKKIIETNLRNVSNS